MSSVALLDAPLAPSPAEVAVVPDGESLYELYYGRRVEKAVSAIAVLLANRLARLIGNHADQHDLGEAVLEMLIDLDPAVRLQRRPDVAFLCVKRGVELEVDESAAWAVVPDLAVEVISPSNLAEDVEEKLDEYFAAGVRRVWVIYPRSRKLHDHTSPTTCTRIPVDGVIDGGDILPGFQFQLADPFRGLKPIPIPVVSDE